MCLNRDMPGHASRSRPPSAKSYGGEASGDHQVPFEYAWVCVRVRRPARHQFNLATLLFAIDHSASVSVHDIRGHGAGTQPSIISSEPAKVCSQPVKLCSRPALS